jgi:FMN phosphatase YigB (HAD superfamily)
MDQDLFIATYLKKLVTYLAPHGYDPKELAETIWKGTGAMLKNDGSRSNEEVFWNSFCKHYGEDSRKDEPIFDEYYRTEFQSAKEVCGYTEKAAKLVSELKALGLRIILATNPLFPSIATESRIKWAGIDPSEFEYITTYDNSTYCKPNPDYYRELIEKLDLDPEKCIMVGNDTSDDMVAEKLGIKVFLLTDCLINTKNEDINKYPHGNFEDLAEYIKNSL